MQKSGVVFLCCALIAGVCSQCARVAPYDDEDVCNCDNEECDASEYITGTEIQSVDSATGGSPSDSVKNWADSESLDDPVDIDSEDHDKIDIAQNLWCEAASDCLANRWYALPRATQNVNIFLNLNSENFAPLSDWGEDDPGVSSNFSTAITVYDSRGTPRRVDAYFMKNSKNTQEWFWRLLVNTADLTEAPWGFFTEVGSGELLFTADGFLASEIVTVTPRFDFTGAAQNQQIELDFGESILEGGTGWHGSTSFASTSSVLAMNQDGHDGSGLWLCVDNTCEQSFGNCENNGLDTPCCGDTTCNPADGKNGSTCSADCNWQCQQDVDCVGRQWPAFNQPTTDMEINVNLDGGADIPAMAWDTNEPSLTSNFDTKGTIYDQNGTPHNLDFYFAKQTQNYWKWWGVIDGGEIAGGESGVHHVFANGELTFTADGFLQEETVEMKPQIRFKGSTEVQTFFIHFDDTQFTGGAGFRTTQYFASFTVRTIIQDGHRGTGHWRCASGNQCIPDYDACDFPPTPECCGDGICKPEFGMDEFSCPSACDSL